MKLRTIVRAAAAVLLLGFISVACSARYGQTEVRLAPLGTWHWDYPAGGTGATTWSNVPATH